MGERDAARVDVMAVLGVARGYDAIADMVEAGVDAHLAHSSFDGAAAVGNAPWARPWPRNAIAATRVLATASTVAVL